MFHFDQNIGSVKKQDHIHKHEHKKALWTLKRLQGHTFLQIHEYVNKIGQQRSGMNFATNHQPCYTSHAGPSNPPDQTYLLNTWVLSYSLFCNWNLHAKFYYKTETKDNKPLVLGVS